MRGAANLPRDTARPGRSSCRPRSRCPLTWNSKSPPGMRTMSSAGLGGSRGRAMSTICCGRKCHSCEKLASGLSDARAFARETRPARPSAPAEGPEPRRSRAPSMSRLTTRLSPCSGFSSAMPQVVVSRAAASRSWQSARRRTSYSLRSRSSIVWRARRETCAEHAVGRAPGCTAPNSRLISRCRKLRSIFAMRRSASASRGVIRFQMPQMFSQLRSRCR